MIIRLQKDKYVCTRKSTDKNGNTVEEQVVYKSFPAFDPDVFIDTFNDCWFPAEKNGYGDTTFKLSPSTANLLEIMEKVSEVKQDIYAVKKNVWGKDCAIGDKMYFRATKLVVIALMATMQDVKNQKQYASEIFKTAGSKKIQDDALEMLMDRIAEEETLNKCIKASATAQVLFRKEDRKELVKAYFEDLNIENNPLAQSNENDDEKQNTHQKPFEIKQNEFIK